MSLKLAMVGFLSKPVSRTFVILTVSFILLVGATLFMLIQSFSHALDDVKATRVMTAYLETTLVTERETALAQKIKKINGVDSAHLINKDAFLENFSKYFPQLSQDVTLIDPEVIPRYIKIKVNEKNTGAVENDVRKIPGIESVETYERRFTGLISALVTLRRFSVFLLSGAVVALVSLLFNHFKVDTHHRSQVITTMKLMGAGTWHATMPFFIEGLIEGLLGGVIAAVTLVSAARIFNHEVSLFFSAIGYRSHEILIPPVGIAVVMVGIIAGVTSCLWAIGLSSFGAHKNA